jgi:hypothetical protein
LQHAPGFHPFEGTALFTRIGGQPTVDRFVDALYDRFEIRNARDAEARTPLDWLAQATKAVDRAAARRLLSPRRRFGCEPFEALLARVFP